MCFTVERRTGGKNTLQIFHCLFVPSHWPEIPLGEHARHVLFRLRLKPYRVATSKQKRKGLLFGDDTAADREHGAFMFRQHTFQTAMLYASIPRLSIERKNFTQRQASVLLDFLVQLNKRRL